MQKKIIEITRTLTPLFILFHLNTDSRMRLEGLHCKSILSFFWCHKLAKKHWAQNSVSFKLVVGVFFNSVLMILNPRTYKAYLSSEKIIYSKGC